MQVEKNETWDVAKILWEIKMQMKEIKMTYLLTWGMVPKKVKYHVGRNVWGGIHLPTMASFSLLLWTNKRNLNYISLLPCRVPTTGYQNFDAFLVFLLFYPTSSPGLLYWNLFAFIYGQTSHLFFFGYFPFYRRPFFKFHPNIWVDQFAHVILLFMWQSVELLATLEYEGL